MHRSYDERRNIIAENRLRVLSVSETSGKCCAVCCYSMRHGCVAMGEAARHGIAWHSVKRQEETKMGFAADAHRAGCDLGLWEGSSWM
jgi:hypothetical protein